MTPRDDVGVGQELSRLVGIVVVRRLGAVVSRVSEQAVEFVPVAVVERLDDRVAIDRVLHGLPELLHREGRMGGLVEDDEVVESLGRPFQ
jgi:hypothetical protein